MTREEIIKLMDWHPSIVNDGPNSLLARVERVVRTAEEAEREACAVTAWSAGMDAHNNAAGLPCDARETGAQCAAAIRARGEK